MKILAVVVVSLFFWGAGGSVFALDDVAVEQIKNDAGKAISKSTNNDYKIIQYKRYPYGVL